MLDRHVAFSSILAAIFWLAALVLAVIDAFLHAELEAMATVMAALAGVLTIKAHVRQDAKAASTAFRLGQESARLRPLKD